MFNLSTYLVLFVFSVASLILNIAYHNGAVFVGFAALACVIFAVRICMCLTEENNN